MIEDIQNNADFGDDNQVEAVITAAFAPECIADAGLVQQGGLRRLLPWFFGG